MHNLFWIRGPAKATTVAFYHFHLQNMEEKVVRQRCKKACQRNRRNADSSFSCPLASSSSLSETTSTGRGTRSSAWPGWPKTSWPRSPTSYCPSWRAEGSSRGRHSPPRRCRTSASASKLLPPPTPLPLQPSHLHSPPPLFVALKWAEPGSWMTCRMTI